MPRKPRNTASAEFSLSNAASGTPDAGGDAGNAASGASDAGNGATVINLDSTTGAGAGTGEPGTGGNDNHGGDGSEPKRRRGRPPGSTSKAKTIPGNVAGIEKLLIGIHTGIAIIASAPEFVLDTDSKDYDGKSEATYLAQSIKDVADHYAVKYLDQKTIDWINLFQAIGMVYGTRLFAIRERRKAERRNRPQPMQGVKPANPTQQTTTEPKPNGAAPTDVRTGVIPGIGNIEFPADHSLSPKAQQ